MTTPNGRTMAPATLKAVIEAADRAAARGAHGQALRLLLAAEPGPIAPDHEHYCPQCGGVWSHLDETCDDAGAPMLRGDCEGERDREPDGAVDSDRTDDRW